MVAGVIHRPRTNLDEVFLDVSMLTINSMRSAVVWEVEKVNHKHLCLTIIPRNRNIFCLGVMRARRGLWCPIMRRKVLSLYGRC